MVSRGLSPARAVGLAVSAVAVTTLLAGCSVDDAFAGFGWPKGITQQGDRMYDLWIGSVVAALVVGVFVWGLIFWCVVRYRKRGDELPPQTRYNMPFEILYTVAPFVIIAVLFFYTAIIQTDVDRLSKNPDVNVEVIASKWNWQFVYSDTKGPDGKPITTVGADDYIPVLVLPAGKSVQFKETSRDVIHSFWVPDILFKRDVIPGVENRFEINLKDSAAGAYVGRCAELCGTYHSMMNFELRVVSADQYQQYLGLRGAGKSTPEALAQLGFPNQGYATTTHPFDTDRTKRSSS
ncbi:cytochrome c oxidase subunit II [Dactylosporangium sp. NPDC005555]|uniref:aa3-type cytochrome oxidase subunit II n=1 Tax=Dactylosporangium sp. NPDC005555 TaxID=3154889 RepID=UPI0033B18ECD